MGIFSEIAWKLKGIWLDFCDWLERKFYVYDETEDPKEIPPTEKLDIDIRFTVRTRKR